MRGKDEASILATLGLRRPRGLERPDPAWRAGEIPDGWFVVFAVRHPQPPEFDDRRLGELSGGAELILVTVEEHAAVSAVSGWRNGSRIWTAESDGQKGDDHLAASGDLPSAYPALRDALRPAADEDDAGGDPFEIPLALASELTGFRHDDAALPGVASATPGPAAKPWWKLW